MISSWNGAEDDAMRGLPMLARVIYLCALRRYMDYKTGVVGRVRRISMQMLRELVEVDSAYAVDNRDARPTDRMIRTALEQLQRAGLAERQRGDALGGKAHTLVFFLPLAGSDQSVRNSDVTVTSRWLGHGDVTEKCNYSGALDCGCGGVASQSRHGSDVTPPELPDIKTCPVRRARARGRSDPTTPIEWAVWMVDEFGYHFSAAQTPSTMTVYRDWCKRGVTAEQVRDGAAAAVAKLGGQKPARPDYFRRFVDEVVMVGERIRNDRARGIGQPVPGKPGAAELARQAFGNGECRDDSERDITDGAERLD